MFVRAYLRASTDEQDANRARTQLEDFAKEHGHTIASWYVENDSGAKADRPELRRLLNDAQPGDVLLVEAIDRLTRLSTEDWKRLKAEIEGEGLRIVACDLPTSYAGLTITSREDFTARMLDAINGMLLDMLAAVARKDYEDRRRRQTQGIAKAKAAGKYNGRPKNEKQRGEVRELLEAGFSVRKAAKLAKCSTWTVQSVREEMGLLKPKSSKSEVTLD